MRRLMLLRHAKTERDAPSGRDRDRRLDERGELDAAEMGSWIDRNDEFHPDLILVSTATRAQQTWQSLPAGLQAKPAEHRAEIYNADVTGLLNLVRHTDDAVGRLLVIGHNPGLHEMALMMDGGGKSAIRRALDENLPTSGLVVLDFDADEWTDIGFRGAAIACFMSPKLLRQAAD